MDWHAFVVFGVIFYVSHLRIAQSFPVVYATIRERRSPQNNGMFIQPILDGRLNIQQVASTVRKHLHDLVDTVTNPLIGSATAVNSPEAYYEQYDYDYQQYNNPPPPTGPRFEHGRYKGGPPHRHHPLGPPPRGHHPKGPPPHYHHGPPPRFHGPPPRFHGPPHRFPPDVLHTDNSSEEDTQNSGQTRPDFSGQPNYPVGGGSSSSTTSINMDEKSQKSEEASNVAGYIEDNFPVILLNENEIRR